MNGQKGHHDSDAQGGRGDYDESAHSKALLRSLRPSIGLHTPLTLELQQTQGSLLRQHDGRPTALRSTPNPSEGVHSAMM